MAGIDYSVLFPNSKMAAAARLGQSYFRSAEATSVAVSGGTTYATWDPATVTAVTLSGGNLIATSTGTTSPDQGAHVVAASGKTSGKYYFEVNLFYPGGAGGGNVGAGIGTVGSTFTTIGGNATTGVILYNSGNVWSNNTNTGVAFGNMLQNTNYLCGIAVDLNNLKIWFRLGAGNWNANVTYNPATNVGGLTIPAGTMIPFCTMGGTSGGAGTVWTANFGATTFSGAVPSGFTAGWPA